MKDGGGPSLSRSLARRREKERCKTLAGGSLRERLEAFRRREREGDPLRYASKAIARALCSANSLCCGMICVCPFLDSLLFSPLAVLFKEEAEGKRASSSVDRRGPGAV